MNRAYTIREIAEALGVHLSNAKRRANREAWPFTETTGIGGKRRQYQLTDLPKAVRDRLLAQATRDAATQIAQPQTEQLPTPMEQRLQVAEMNDSQRDVMHARALICSLIDEIAAVHNVSRRAAIVTFLGEAEAGELAPETMQTLQRANARRGSKRLANKATIYRWFERRDKQGATALATKKQARSGVPDWLPKLLAIYQQPQKHSVAACIEREWPKHYPDTTPPPLRTAQRHLQAMPAELREYGRMGTNARRAVQPFVRRTTDGLWPMDVVTVDGHLFKAYVRHPLTGRRFRPEVTVYLDVATRRAVGFSAWLAESQFAIWCAMREMVLDADCGVPAIHYSDNGAYRGEQHRAVLARIGTSMMFSQAYRAQARGIIERFNSSVWVPLAKSLPTYVGQDMDPEAVKRSLKRADTEGDNLVGWAEFVDGCRAALDDYNNRRHSSIRKTPNQAWAEAVDQGWQPTPLGDGDDLHDLLPSFERKCSRGEISLPWGRYFHDELRHWHGRQVRVGVHPTDGEQAWISDMDGVLICVAKRDGNAKPYMPDNQLQHARDQRETGRIKRLERKLDQVREENAHQLDTQPRPQLGVQSADILEAQLHDITRIAAEREAAEAERLDASRRALAAELAQPAPVTPITDDPRARYRQMARIEQRIDAGEVVSEDERKRLARYQGTTEYRVQKEFFEDFGLDLNGTA